MNDSEVAWLEEEPTTVRLAKSQIMSIRLNDTELRLLTAAAHRAGVKVGSFVKRAALEAAEAGNFSPQPTVQFGVTEGGYAYSGFSGQPRNAMGLTGVEIRFTAGQGTSAPTGN